MKANPEFLRKPMTFWAHVRSLSQEIGYTDRDGRIKVPTMDEIVSALQELDLHYTHLTVGDSPTPLGRDLLNYFRHRAKALKAIKERLQNKATAGQQFRKLKSELKPKCPIPLNKQKGKKKAPAYLTGIVNMLIEKHSHSCECDYDPRSLTTITRGGIPVRTLARRVDGAFPSCVNPIAVWEIKEYYYTTTFGSRVADGVYESLLDGLELEELREQEGIDVKHYLMVDDYFTWWKCGRSYLCRLVDMLHMGYVDEILFGSEVLTRLPGLVKEWVTADKKRRFRKRS